MNELSRCLCCDLAIISLIDFGDMPLVNTYSITDRFPLKVNRCVSCCHLQLSQFVDPEILYRNYSYCSGTGKTASNYFKEFARIALSYFPTARTVLDIACNDGSQLDAFKELGLDTHGIEPARNIAEIAYQKEHKMRFDFFEAIDIPVSYDIITAQNVIGHTPTPLRFLEKCRDIMHDQSRLFVQTSQANLIVNGECDTIYHEHISYFNAHSMLKLSARAGLVLLDVLMHEIHGTSYIFVFGKSGTPTNTVKDRVEWEFCTGMTGPPLYRWWVAHVKHKINRIHHQIENYSKQGYYLVGCGAAAKGISMLNMANVQLYILADTTPAKWGKFASGMEIVPFETIGKLDRDKIMFVILAWNLRREVQENVLKLRNNSADVFIDLR